VKPLHPHVLAFACSAVSTVRPVPPVVACLRASAGASGGGDDDDEGPGDPSVEHGEDVDLEDAPVSATPRRYKVIFHNDDYTTMEFVVEVLKRYFHKTDTEAVHIMLTIHKMGAAVAAVYTRDVAETKAAEVMEYARENGMPLMVTTEPE
jgi:ATP-dependent Clp protease adaptor protein ClpS